MFLPLHDRNPTRYIHFAYVTYTLIAFNILVFLVQSMLSQNQFETLVINFGVMPAIINGLLPSPLGILPKEITLVTYCFMHLDWMHLLSNMLFLWIFGDNIEDALGHVRFALFYLACAAFAAGTHILFNGASTGPLIGASGAVAGVMGAYVLLFPHARLFVLATIVIPIPLPIPAFWMLGFWIATQLFYALGGSPDPVAWWAHLGGFLSGVLLALLFKRQTVQLLGGR